MKQVAGSLRLDLAQYRELAAFAQFGSDLDKATAAALTRGEHMTELLKQNQYSPMNVIDQVISIFAGSNGFLDDLPLDKVLEFEKQLLQDIHTNHADIFDTLSKEKKISDDTKAALKDAIKQFKEGFAQ